MRTTLVLMACLAPGTATNHCSSSEFAADDVMYLQHTVRDVKAVAPARFPDLGNVVNKITGAVDDAATRADAVMGDALSTVGNVVNGTLEKLETAIDEYVNYVNATAGSIKVGVTSLLADAFSINVPGLQASKEDQQNALSAVGKADDIVAASLMSLTDVSKTLDAIPAQIFSVSDEVNASFQGALAQCRTFSTAIRDVQRILQDAAGNFTQRKVAALMQMPTNRFAFAVGDSPEVVIAHAAMVQMAEADTPSATISSLTGALQTLSEKSSAFSSSFEDAFGSLSESVEEFAKGKLGIGASTKVIVAFDGALATSRGAMDRAITAFDQLHGSIAEGVAQVGLQNAAFGPVPKVGVLGVAMLSARWLLAAIV